MSELLDLLLDLAWTSHRLISQIVWLEVLLIGEFLWARQCKAGGGELNPAGAWLTTRQTLTSCSSLAPSLA
eukprot:1138699-Pelagomonas_calceolata.AAC.5